jgi:hypothetical protein
VAPPTKSPQGSIELKVSIELEGVLKDEEEPQLAAYAFSPGGSLIGHAPLKAKSSVALKIPAREDAQAVRVVVGPRGSAEEEAPLANLLRLNAGERTIRVEPGAARAEAEFIIARPIWLCWLLGRCPVRGTLLKREQSGGIPIDMPVCGAEVEVYEVEALLILLSRIPEELLERLRAIVRFPPPPPPPPEEGLFGPLPPAEGPELGAVRELLAAAQGSAGAPAPQLPASPRGDYVTRGELAQVAEERFAQLQGTKVAGDEVERTIALAPAPIEAPSLEEAAGAVRALADSSAVALAASQGSAAFRNALIANEELVRPILCLFFPWWVSKQLVATTTTDECGHFSATFWRGCPSERVNLYFMAYRRILYFRIPIYQPLPVVCNTFWNYVCGTEVTLYSTSPFAYTCPPCRPIVAAPHWVLVMAIGNTPLSRIHGTGAPLTTAENVGLTDQGAPFGGLLRPRLEFDNSLRDELGVRYYRVSWKRAGTGTSTPWVPLELEVHRHYTHVVGSSLVLEAYSLGPHVVGGQAALFEIPPALPPIGQWSVPDAVEDTTSAKFATGGSQPATFGLVPPGSEGVYKLRIELFDAAGAPVAIAPLGIHFVVPTSTDLSSTIYTTDAAALGLVPGPPVDTGNAFVMRLHVDNNPTSAAIAPPLLNGSVPPDPNCGVIAYAPKGSDTLTIAYTASHPHGFANYSFVLKRGVTTLTPPSASGPVGAGSFSSAPAVSSLLGACTVAGFAEELRVAGTATDGWTPQGYDANDLRAFVLKPSEP